MITILLVNICVLILVLIFSFFFSCVDCGFVRSVEMKNVYSKFKWIECWKKVEKMCVLWKLIWNADKELCTFNDITNKLYQRHAESWIYYIKLDGTWWCFRNLWYSKMTNIFPKKKLFSICEWSAEVSTVTSIEYEHRL